MARNTRRSSVVVVGMFTVCFTWLASISATACSSSGSGPGVTEDAAGPQADSQAISDSGSAGHADTAGSPEDGAPSTIPLHCEHEADGSSCICIQSSTPDPTPECSAADFSPDGTCCADLGYPSQSLSECLCQPWSCFVSSAVCNCSAVGGTPTPRGATR